MQGQDPQGNLPRGILRASEGEVPLKVHVLVSSFPIIPTKDNVLMRECVKLVENQ